MDIFLDESGFTGEDLFNKEQSAMVLASHNYSEEEAKTLKNRFFGTDSLELKHKKLYKTQKGREQILAYLSYVYADSSHVKAYVVHKKFALVGKIVDILIEPTARAHGFDIHERNGHVAFSRVLFYCIPTFGGQWFFENLLSKFQEMIRTKSPKSYTDFFRFVAIRHPNKDLDELLDFIRVAQSMGPNLISESSLDVAVTAAFSIVIGWHENSLEDKVRVIHDKSKAMSRDQKIWDALVDPKNPQMLLNKSKGIAFPLKVTETVLGDSKDWVGLELADILAGANAYRAECILHHHETPYFHELNKIIETPPQGTLQALWPEFNLSEESLRTQGDDVKATLDYMMSVLYEAESKEKKGD